LNIVTERLNSHKWSSKSEERRNVETIGGFSDADVHQVRQPTKSYKGRIIPFLNRLFFEEILPYMRQHEVIIVDDDTTLTRPSTSSPTSTAGHVNIASSRAFSMLPAFVKDHWKSQILPSVRDAIGQSRTPWDLDQKMNTFETILQTIIDTIYGPNYHKVVRGTQIYVQMSCLQLFIQAHTIDEYLKAKQAVYD
jgi:hypothetical protein